jgi:hypothetical protein
MQVFDAGLDHFSVMRKSAFDAEGTGSISLSVSVKLYVI